MNCIVRTTLFFFRISVSINECLLNVTLLARIAYLNDIIPYWPDWILAFVMLLLYFFLTFVWKFDDNCPRGYLGI